MKDVELVIDDFEGLIMETPRKFDVIVFLTATYPFGDSESFIENEIDFLKKSCNRLIIIPFSERQYKCSRLQEDEMIEIIKMNDSLIEWIVALIKVIFSKAVWRDWFALWKSGRNIIYSTGCLLYFSIKSFVRFSQISPLIQKWSHERKKLVYSYWAGTQAYVGQCVKKRDNSFIFITRAHGYDLYQERPEYLPFRKETFQGSDEIFPVSKHGARYLCNRFPMFKEKISPFYLGTKDYGVNEVLSGQIFHIVSCSSMVALKRIHLIIEALSMMRHKIRWTHYGTGPLKKELEDKASLLSNNIHWTFKGNVANQTLMDEYKNTGIDLFVNVSTSEGLPVSIMEAASFGIPIVATEVGGTPEIVQDGINGYLLPSDLTGSQLKNAIEKFLRLSVQQKENMRLQARKIWKEKFCAEDNYKKFYAYLEKYL